MSEPKKLTSYDYEKFKQFAKNIQKRIKEHTSEIEDEMKIYYESGTFTKMICLRESKKIGCGEDNKMIFSLRNKLKHWKGEGDYFDKQRKGLYKIYSKELGEPVVGVILPIKNDPEFKFLKFGIVCPYANSEVCILKNYEIKGKKEEV